MLQWNGIEIAFAAVGAVIGADDADMVIFSVVDFFAHGLDRRIVMLDCFA